MHVIIYFKCLPQIKLPPRTSTRSSRLSRVTTPRKRHCRRSLTRSTVLSTKSMVTLLVALDISAAFDALDHGTILRQLNLEYTFGIPGAMLDWIRSYITEREQFVKLGIRCSKRVHCVSGVPQGSVLGPTIFALYVSPVAAVIEDFGFKHHQYADDTQLFISLDRSNIQNAIELLVRSRIWSSVGFRKMAFCST